MFVVTDHAACGGTELLAKVKKNNNSVQVSTACCHYSGCHDLLTGTKTIFLKM